RRYQDNAAPSRRLATTMSLSPSLSISSTRQAVCQVDVPGAGRSPALLESVIQVGRSAAFAPPAATTRVARVQRKVLWGVVMAGESRWMVIGIGRTRVVGLEPGGGPRQDPHCRANSRRNSLGVHPV